ncbi:MAG TPA: hypothetical protein PLV45_17180, partial [bacterium]|nr:hypothetical protein [bacterium]
MKHRFFWIVTAGLLWFLTGWGLTRNIQAECGDFFFHASEFTPDWIWDGGAGIPVEYINDIDKTFFGDAPWRVESLDTVIPIYFQIEGTNDNAINELHCLGIYDVSDGSEPPEPVESFWGNYEYTPDSDRQVFKAECGGCELAASEDGMYWRTVTAFENDGASGGTQPDGTALTARNMGYTEADLGTCITLTVRIIYEEEFNWTDIHDQDFKIYLAEAPLPRQDNWYLGDPHTHTWSSYYIIEMGASGYTMFQSQAAGGGLHAVGGVQVV